MSHWDYTLVLGQNKNDPLLPYSHFIPALMIAAEGENGMIGGFWGSCKYLKERGRV